MSTNARNQTVVQFDDVTTGYGGGWHLFDGDVWEPDQDHEPQFSVSQDGGPMHAHLLGKAKLDNY